MIARIKIANAMAVWVVSLLNRGDFVGIKALLTDDFMKGDASEQLSRLVAGVHALGTLTKPELILDITEQRHYLVRVKRVDKPERLLLLVLGVESAAKCFSIGLAPYKTPAPSPVAGGTDNPRKSATDTAVQATVERYTGQNSPAGIAIATLYRGQERYYNYGEVVRGGKVLPTSRTIFEIGSITKTMTGVLLAQAVRDKKLQIDDDIRRYLPGKYPQLEFGGKPIRVRHLAKHTSGLPASPPGIPDSAGAAASVVCCWNTSMSSPM
jgi:Beta-lactamase